MKDITKRNLFRKIYRVFVNKGQVGSGLYEGSTEEGLGDGK